MHVSDAEMSSQDRLTTEVVEKCHAITLMAAKESIRRTLEGRMPLSGGIPADCLFNKAAVSRVLASALLPCTQILKLSEKGSKHICMNMYAFQSTCLNFLDMSHYVWHK